jgi:hypothetical protein
MAHLWTVRLELYYSLVLYVLCFVTSKYHQKKYFIYLPMLCFSIVYNFVFSFFLLGTTQTPLPHFIGLILAELSQDGLFVRINKSRFAYVIHFILAGYMLVHLLAWDSVNALFMFFYPPAKSFNEIWLERLVFSACLLVLLELNQVVRMLFQNSLMLLLGKSRYVISIYNFKASDSTCGIHSSTALVLSFLYARELQLIFHFLARDLKASWLSFF